MTMMMTTTTMMMMMITMTITMMIIIMIIIMILNICFFSCPTGITFPSGEVQKQLLQDVYTQACVDPSKVAYVEAHGTGTKAGDPQEVNTIVDVFCKERAGSLPIGSTKSNMGHPEPASGIQISAHFLYFQ
jgi:3-oxoacyl-(acyl-carrier-protein) synthase